LLALAWLLLWMASPAPTIFLAAALGYIGIVSATSHKENRFLYPALVLLTVAAAPLFVSWAAESWKGSRRPLALATAVAGLSFFLFPSPFDVQRKEQFQLVARNAASTTGLVIMNEGMWGSPGFFYLGRNIPWCPCDFPHDGCFQMAARDARFNRGLYWSSEDPQRDAQSEAAFVAAGFRVAKRSGLAVWFER
ncbi:MAG: mannosyltransferase, partial [Myxococcota bacterium]